MESSRSTSSFTRPATLALTTTKHRHPVSHWLPLLLSRPGLFAGLNLAPTGIRQCTETAAVAPRRESWIPTPNGPIWPEPPTPWLSCPNARVWARLRTPGMHRRAATSRASAEHKASEMRQARVCHTSVRYPTTERRRSDQPSQPHIITGPSTSTSHSLVIARHVGLHSTPRRAWHWLMLDISHPRVDCGRTTSRPVGAVSMSPLDACGADSPQQALVAREAGYFKSCSHGLAGRICLLLYYHVDRWPPPVWRSTVRTASHAAHANSQLSSPVCQSPTHQRPFESRATSLRCPYRETDSTTPGCRHQQVVTAGQAEPTACSATRSHISTDSSPHQPAGYFAFCASQPSFFCGAAA